MSALPLAFQKEIVAELVAEDALLIMAKGLGLRNILGAFLQIYSQPQNLVLLINTSAEEETALREDLLRSSGIDKGGASYFKSITSEQSLTERSELYRYGGVMAITSRILVMDLLTGRVPVQLITGILVANAHRVTASSTEAFILRLFRQSNTEGFIKAFSDQPEALSTGFATLEKTLRLLYLRKVNLWPRFHVTVTESLESHTADVIEIRQPMTKGMKAIQAAIISCMDICLQELRRSSSAIEIDVDDFTVEKALFKSFDVIIRRQLDPIWHRVSQKTKQLVGDLKILRSLLGYLVSYDSVNFNLYLETLLASVTPHSGNYWMMTEPADKIFSTAKSRVFLQQEGFKDPDDPNVLPNMRPVLEELPKWNILSEIMDEVEVEMHNAPHPGLDTVLIMAQDQRTCSQLRRYLSTPKTNTSTRGKPLMRDLLHGYLRWKSNMKHFKDNVASKAPTSLSTAMSSSGNSTTGVRRGQPANKRRRVRGGGNSLAPVAKHSTASFEKEAEVIATFINTNNDISKSSARVYDQDLEEVDDFTDYFGLIEPSNMVLVHSYSGESDSLLLENIKPRFIVMYDPDPTFVRCIEVYKACHPGKQVRVYFTVYDNSVEEQLYLSALRREKDSFTRLIQTKSTMVLPIGDTFTKQAQDQSLLRNIHTRIAGGGKTGDERPPPRIVVDAREFRSSLPSILHSQGMVLDPCTITVGDYVLSPNICVERKSISDLIQSFASGRLYTQVEAMAVHYTRPVLLIEFDEDKSFSLQDKADIRADISVSELQSKLVLLTLAFPTLRTIWSSSVHSTVEIFEDLKRSEDEPDMLQAQAVGVDADQAIDSAYNLTPQDILRSLPGITSKNYKSVMRSVENIRELAELDVVSLSNIIGEGPGKTLWDFFHRDSRMELS
ncbi:hypothetical protein BGZ95_009148 [Linnemannia exigua]|uniref:ERCC4 domain-containing protein n=1 Tax=Linnemannia exigua TaxID=604196 RepID=A0AAD4DF12_9FUNG|nr:hypothetical protein BGZ95_009148 [Linnemannia exigua]